jgi:hypothetical protein
LATPHGTSAADSAALFEDPWNIKNRNVQLLRNSWIQLSLQNESALNESVSMNVF